MYTPHPNKKVEDAGDDDFARMEMIMAEAAAAKGIRERPAASQDTREGPSPKRGTNDCEGKRVPPRAAPTKKGCTEYYNGGTIYISERKQGYRVLFPGEKRVDVLFRWQNYSSKSACLTDVKRKIDERA